MMHPHFARLVSELSGEIAHLSAAQVEAHPCGDPSRWNIRQIVEHLVLTYRLSGANLQERLAKGRSTNYRPTLSQLSSKFVLLRLGYFPRGRPAPPAVVPSIDSPSGTDGHALLAIFGTELQKLNGSLDACEARFGEGALATHQILGPLSVGEWRQFHLAHARHHLKQIRRLNFPLQ